jgi:hypothetical protein
VKLGEAERPIIPCRTEPARPRAPAQIGMRSGHHADAARVGRVMAEAPRRFPPPWTVDKIPGGHVVRDANGQALAYVYSRENEAEARRAKVLTADEGRRIAANIARLPELLGKGESQQGWPTSAAALGVARWP